ncbi:MAG: response regulator [Ignavibacteriaceae bacterium]|jgi:CheY-like chemotaxis protein/glycine cleavage system H lipoate-binding protein
MINQEKILIIDDEQVILDAVSKIASLEGWKIVAVLNAQNGLNKLSCNQYSLILSDIMMPELDGFQLLEELYNRHIDIPVIMITGYSTVENAVKSLHKGAIDFIPKPFTIDEITSSINRGLKYRNIQVRLEEAEKCGTNESVIYVPCPPKYKRLGYMSWMNLENEGVAVVGVTDLFLETIEDTLKVELLEVEELLIQGNSCVKFETNDGLIHTCLAPLGGRIVERNERIFATPSLLEKDPFFEGWLYRIIPSDYEYDMKYLNSCSSDRM